MSDPILVILAAPCSHASLVSAMLGQHPEMFSLPDTNVFVSDQVDAMLDSHSRMGKGASDGLLRLLAQLHDGKQSDETVQAARNWLDEHGGWTTGQLFDSVYERMEPRFMVDASPVNALDEMSLERLCNNYPDANFLHLTRHPRSVAASYMGVRESKDNTYIWNDDIDNEEQVWLKPNSMIEEFALSLPEGQCMRLMSEQLFEMPEKFLFQIAQWLDLSIEKKSINAMLHPEKMLYAKYGPPSAPCGMETGFLEQPGMPKDGQKASLLDALPPSEIEFSAETLKLAREYGYQ